MEKTAKELGFQEKIKEMQLLALGPFKDVQLFYQDKEQVFNKEIMEQIKQRWQEHLKRRPNDFPGTLVHARGLDTSRDNQILKLYIVYNKWRLAPLIGTIYSTNH